MTDFLLFIALVAGGVLLEVVLFKLFLSFVRSRLSADFILLKYCYLLSIPLLAVLVIMQRTGTVVLYVFFITSLVGTLFEFLAGFAYKRVTGERLWTYHRYTVSEYTSMLSLPMWGLAGVLLWLLARVFD
jgi:hypothetical protein